MKSDVLKRTFKQQNYTTFYLLHILFLLQIRHLGTGNFEISIRENIIGMKSQGTLRLGLSPT